MSKELQAVSMSKIDIEGKPYRCYTLNNEIKVLAPAHGKSLPDINNLQLIAFYKGDKEIKGYELNAFMNALVEAGAGSSENAPTKKEPLSSFNQKLKKALNFDPKKGTQP